VPVVELTFMPRARPLAWLGVVALGLASAMAAMAARAGAPAADDPAVWVERMNQVLANRNYDGVFVHQLGEHRETMRIIHRVQDGHLTERVVSTDGSGREFIRDGNELVGYFPDRRIVVVEKRPRSLGFIGGLPGFDPAGQSNYEVRDVERTRLQGRPARVITVTPRDTYRYGYRLWIDEKTAMPVKTQLASLSGEIIEQITFASLTMPTRIEDEILKAEVDTEGFRWLRREPPSARPGQVLAWSAQTLPPGFRRGAGGVSGMPGPPKPSSHLVFTDGLASVSVFIESAGTPPPQSRTGEPHQASGPAQLGAASAFTTIFEGFRVTAVGEVPPQTVKVIAESLRPVPDVALAGDAALGRAEPPAGTERPAIDATRGLRSLGAPSVPQLDRNAARP
jgi:sigma-E factor negative regulatory protein RseB